MDRKSEDRPLDWPQQVAGPDHDLEIWFQSSWSESWIKLHVSDLRMMSLRHWQGRCAWTPGTFTCWRGADLCPEIEAMMQLERLLEGTPDAS